LEVPQWTLITVAAVIIGLRCNLRLRIQRVRLTASDWLMLCAWMASVTTASFDIVFASYKVLRPDLNYILATYDGTPEDTEYIFKVSVTREPAAGWALRLTVAD
jgi:hypothetical protein